MRLDKIIKDLKDMRKAGFIDCNIQCLLDKLEKVTIGKVTVPRYVANWYEKNKYDLEFSIWDYTYMFDGKENTSFKEWFADSRNNPFKTLVSMHQLGYKVDEKLYLVKAKGIKAGEAYLNYNSNDKVWYFDNRINGTTVKTFHTKEELEKAGFGWVFNSPGVEVTEVEEG